MQMTPWQRFTKLVPVHILIEALHGYDRHHCLYMAAAISFYAMISLGPLVYLAFVGLQIFIGSSHQAQAQLLTSLESFMLPEAAEQLVTRVVGASLLGPLTSLGTWWAGLALLWAGISFYDALTAIFTLAWGGSAQRLFLARKFRAATAFVGAGVFFVLTILMTGAIAFVEGLGDQYLGINLDTLWLALGWLLPYAFAIAVFFLLYKFLPNAPVSWRLALMVAIPVGIIWELSKRAFVVLGGGFAGDFYGPLAWFVLLMVWIYWSSSIVLLGAEIGAAWQKYEEGYGAEAG